MRNKSIDLLIELLILSAHKFRLGKEAEGSSLFRECINLLEVILNTEESPDDLQINHQIRVEAHLVA